MVLGRHETCTKGRRQRHVMCIKDYSITIVMRVALTLYSLQVYAVARTESQLKETAAATGAVAVPGDASDPQEVERIYDHVRRKENGQG